MSVAHRLFNRLQATAESLNTDVVNLKEEFGKLPFVAHQMSGSGTSYFGICRNRRDARRLANRLRLRSVGTVFVASSRV